LVQTVFSRFQIWSKFGPDLVQIRSRSRYMAVQIKKSGRHVRTCCPDSGPSLDRSRPHYFHTIHVFLPKRPPSSFRRSHLPPAESCLGDGPGEWRVARRERRRCNNQPARVRRGAKRGGGAMRDGRRDERGAARRERGGAAREGWHNERGTARRERRGAMREVVARQERAA
jgi:hypothetical protein